MSPKCIHKKSFFFKLSYSGSKTCAALSGLDEIGSVTQGSASLHPGLFCAALSALPL
jgi:hypothetical protein